jgi:hypothetical protein
MRTRSTISSDLNSFNCFIWFELVQRFHLMWTRSTISSDLNWLNLNARRLVQKNSLDIGTDAFSVISPRMLGGMWVPESSDTLAPTLVPTRWFCLNVAFELWPRRPLHVSNCWRWHKLPTKWLPAVACVVLVDPQSEQSSHQAKEATAKSRRFGRCFQAHFKARENLQEPELLWNHSTDILDFSIRRGRSIQQRFILTLFLMRFCAFRATIRHLWSGIVFLTGWVDMNSVNSTNHSRPDFNRFSGHITYNEGDSRFPYRSETNDWIANLHSPKSPWSGRAYSMLAFKFA